MSEEANAVEDGEQPDVVETEDVSTEEVEAQEPETEDPQEEEKPKRNRHPTGKRIGQLTRQKRELEAENRRLKELLKKPNPDDFDDPDDYELARTKHAVRAARSEELDHSAQEIDKTINSEIARDWNNRVAEFKGQAPDFEEVAYRAPISKELSDAIAQMEDGPAIAYHLGKNPQEASDLSDLPPMQAAMQLGRISASLKAPKRKVVTSAPPPVQPVTDGSGPVTKDLSDMSYKEYRALRMAEIRGG